MFFAGCAHVAKKPTGLRPSEFWKDQTVRHYELNKISAKLSLRLEGKKEKVSGPGRMVAQFPKEVRLELRDPFGRVQYLVTLSEPHLVAYYPTQKLAYLDEHAGSRYLKKYMGANWTFQDLQSFILGMLPESTGQTFETWDWDEGRGEYRGQLSWKGRRLTAWVDPVRALLTALKIEEPDQHVKIEYADFRLCCGNVGKMGNDSLVSIGQAVSIKIEESGTLLEVDWNEVKHLDRHYDPEIFQIVLPEDVTKIPLK
jgi:Domain of unknown function (DUF4292)